MHFHLLKILTRRYSRNLFPNKLSHYLHRANLIDSIRLKLRTNTPNSLTPLVNDTHLLDSFVVTQALRSAPSADSALLLNKVLESNPGFVHTQNTVHALATVLAKSGRAGELNYLIEAVHAGRFRNVRLSFMNIMSWQAAVGDLEAVLRTWEEYRSVEKRVCAESYNVVMRVYAELGKDCEAVQVFYRMVAEGALPNCRTYTVMIKHMVKCGKLEAAMEVFKVLPFMRVKRSLRQYQVLVEACVGEKQFEGVKALLEEMRVDGMLPGRAMHLSLKRMQEAGFIEESDEFLREMLPNEGIKSIGYCDDCGDDDDDDDDEERDEEEDADDDDDRAGKGKEGIGVQLKPWLDPRSLTNALQSWSPNEVSTLEEANFVWTTRLVCKILRNFKSAETAWKFFCWVACQPGFTHDIYTVQRMMTLLARHGYAALVDKLLSKVRMEQMRLPFSTIRLIIDFYGLSKNADAALKVFDNGRNLCGPISDFNLMLLYSSLLRTLTKCGRDSDVMDVLEEMILSGICPDIQTFSGLMHHFAQNGDIKTVQKLFAMVRQSGVQPDAYIFKVLIQAYCKCERAALAYRAFEDLRNLNLLPNPATKELLVKSLWKEGKRREAAAVEESCEETNDVLPLTLRGHIWMIGLF
uniref:pentatricopeptide repeat-containing protein At5g66631-like isoform X2 n=1 Tax=Fragaria vesca subsp. vesca TaxID=101020 RepID=UPI0005CA8F71|nr:PREDICTED: pentatricopeptide repeat-containing protein At5g66631-like isoform X2 [Fragaria vesca subsp. vesca]